jgi:hypothetical protein
MSKRRRQGRLKRLTKKDRAKRDAYRERTGRAAKIAAKIKRVPGETKES